MNKVYDYILKGKGIGMSILLGLSIFFSVNFNVLFNHFANMATPHLQDILYRTAPLKIENGTVVVPENTIKKVVLFDYGTKQYSLLIDTTVDFLSANDLPDGLYLTRKKLYFSYNGEIRTQNLGNDIEIENVDYTQFLQQGFKKLAMYVFFLMVFGLFATYMILNVFYALLTKIAELVNKRTLSFVSKLRLNAVLFSVVSLSFFILGNFNIILGKIAFVLIMLILQIIIVKKIPQEL